ncbi:MAG: ABC transporter permease [Gemmatimonadota bacterium]
MKERTAWKIGWRNLGRSRRRTLITASSLALGYVAVVLMSGLALGLVAEMVDNGTGIITGQLQVHADDYLPERDLYATIGGRDGTDLDSIVAAVVSVPGVTAAVPRTFGAGLVSTGSATAAGVLLGTDMEREIRVSRILTMLRDGALPRSGRNEILLGAEMARQVEANVRDTVVLVAPAADGSLGNDLFVVSGIFESSLADIDRTWAFLPLDAAQALLALGPGQIHEVAARVTDPWQAPTAVVEVDAAIRAALGPDIDAHARAWTEFRPEMVEYARLTESMQWLLLALVFGMASFGVANTLLMSSFERRREFALLLALGTRPRLVAGSVVTEALSMAGLSLVVGVVLAAPILVWWHRWPPDVSWLYGGFTFAGGLMRPILRVEYPWRMLFLTALSLFAIAVVAAVLPAVRSARVPPADTLSGR